MAYIPLSNYEYDSGPHQIQSGPVSEGYIVLSSGILDVGADLGVVTPGPATSGVYSTTAWREVPPAISGYWTDFEENHYDPSGVLSVYNGYRPLSVTTIANAKVQTSLGPEFGVRDAGKYTYFGGAAPDNQNYTPYNTPGFNSPYAYNDETKKFEGQGHTGGGVTHGRYEGGLLTNILGSQGTSNRSEWRYHPPVYCKTYTETIRSTVPGLMSPPLRFVYRGGASRYVSNYGSIYYQGSESVRNLVRTFSPSVNSSNQKSI